MARTPEHRDCDCPLGAHDRREAQSMEILGALVLAIGAFAIAFGVVLLVADAIRTLTPADPDVALPGRIAATLAGLLVLGHRLWRAAARGL